jgi:hypothetical protein
MVKLLLVEHKPGSSSVAQTQPVLGIIEALSAGLDAVLRHPWLLLVPVLLDLFLWLGPRMQAPALYQAFEPTLQQMTTAMTSTEARFAAQELSKSVEQFFTQYNLFAWLSAGLIGVPVVNGGIAATLRLVTGSLPILWQVDSFDGYLLVYVLLTIAGLFFSALFWIMLGDYVRGESWQTARWLRRSFKLWKKLLLLTVVVLGLVLMSIVPVSLVMITLSAFSAGLASFVPLLVVAVAAWIILVCLFTPHGLALYHMTLSHAISTSSLIVRANFYATLGLVGIAIAVSVGMGLIWDGLAPDSWLRLIAIAGNAIVGAGLIVASLLFYQNRVTILFESHRWPLPAES